MAEKLEELKYYKMDTLDGTLLFRWAETNKLLLTHRWDRVRNAWMDDPTFIEVTGIGGSTDYDRISENEAVFLMVSNTISPRDAVSLLTEGI